MGTHSKKWQKHYYHDCGMVSSNKQEMIVLCLFIYLLRGKKSNCAMFVIYVP